MNQDSITITQDQQGERLDKVLAAHFDKQSRSYFQYLIDNQLVLVNGQSVKKRYKPKAGDEIEIEFAVTPEMTLEPENIPFDILYEDEYLLAINKSAGMVVHPGAGNWSGTFANALLYHCKQLPQEGDPLRPGIVHRLDKDTSGVLIAAKTTECQQKLVAAFADRKMHKEYLAMCVGNPGEGSIDAPIGRHPVYRTQMTVNHEKGRNAISHFQTLAYNEYFSLVRIQIETGRTHQIRVHMKHLGHPVLGDQIYGSTSLNKRLKTQRQLLHAHTLRFLHPFTGEEVSFQAPLPDDFKLFSQKLQDSPF